ncbi:MAG: elongation factor G [Proteobacteria bacterium]|nr:elongation factor G [Pseudomonadota bacterium]
MSKNEPSAPRCAALVGPYLSGKTSLLESLLAATGAITRKGTIKEGNTVGDSSAESRARQMSTELSVASADYLGDPWTFIDCPGSIELVQDAYNALLVSDAAVIVCEPVPDKALTLAPLMKFLAANAIPHIIFINKMDTATTGVREVFEALQKVSELPLVLREIPIREGDEITGHVDLVSERAFRWNEGKPSELIQIPDTVQERGKEARNEMLETLADFDDTLLEELLEDTVPSTEEIYSNLTRDLREGAIVPVFFGSAERDNGIRRLLKALRHEAPGPQETAARLGIDGGGEALAQVFKTQHASHTGKLSLVRVWRGEVADGDTMGGERVSGVFRLHGQKQEKLSKAGLGEVVALGRLEKVKTGGLLSPSSVGGAWPDPFSPVYSLAIQAEKHADEVKLSGSLAKLTDEDPSLSYEPNQDTGELILKGQGEMHLQINIDRLRNRFNLDATAHRPTLPYKETIQKSISQHARHKKQSGGHGQFGDVHIDIKPLPRGGGFTFESTISGGVVPRQYIPSVEAGVRDYLARGGPLGFPVVDIAVILTDGQYHTVDSSDMAFRAAAQLAMREGMPNCKPVLLEPFCQVKIAVPNEFTSKIQRLISGRRGQILGFDAKAGWKDWDQVSALMPQAEMHDLINELRSITLGVGTYEWSFDNLRELTGKLADQVVQERGEKG